MSMRIFPPERMSKDYPWQVWAVGWLAIFKGILWLAYEPVLPDAVMRLLGFKYILAMVPLVVCGVGLWNRQRWACWGLMLIAIGHLIFFITQPATLHAFLIRSEIPLFSPLLSLVVLLFNGPLGDVLILCAVPSLRTYCRR